MELDFIRLFNKKLEEKNIDWEVSALASPDGKLFSLGFKTYWTNFRVDFLQYFTRNSR